MKKALAVLSTIVLISSFATVGFAKQPCPCATKKPCTCVKTEKPCKVKVEVKGQKTGGAAQVRPVNMTKEQKLDKAKREIKKEAKTKAAKN